MLKQKFPKMKNSINNRGNNLILEASRSYEKGIFNDLKNDKELL